MTVPAPLPAPWRNRIVGHAMVDADQLLANPNNWRIHPRYQQDAIEGLLDDVGWLKSAQVNVSTQFVLDGHARVALAITRGEQVPVEYVDISPEEERLAIVSLDTITMMAGTDAAIMQQNLADIAAAQTAGLLTLRDNSTALLANLVSAYTQPAGLPGGSTGTEAEPEIVRISLVDRFIVPPFTVLDTRQGYWQDRKRTWLRLGIKSELGRGDVQPSGRNSVYTGESQISGYRGPQRSAEGMMQLPALPGSPAAANAQAEREAQAIRSGEGRPDNLLFDSPHVRADGMHHYRHVEREKREAAAAQDAIRSGEGRPDDLTYQDYRVRDRDYYRNLERAKRNDNLPGRGRGPGRTFNEDLLAGEAAAPERQTPAAASMRARVFSQDLGRGEVRRGVSRMDADSRSNLNGAPPMPAWSDIGMANMAPGTSIFDPVLSELIYRWFSPPAGSVLDPFAGGSVRGIVAGVLGRSYTGVDLSEPQVNANRDQLAEIAQIKRLPAAAPAPPPTADSGEAPDSPRKNARRPPAPAPSSPSALTAELADLFRPFRPVTMADAATWDAYYAAFFRTPEADPPAGRVPLAAGVRRRYPRHYLSPLVLASHGKEFIWGIVDGCLCIAKRRTMMNIPTLYLILPPMSPTGDNQAEADVIDRLGRLGVRCKVSEEDIALYGLDPAGLTIDTDNAEYIYRAGDMHAPSGSAFRRERSYWKQFSAKRSDGHARVLFHTDTATLDTAALADVETVVRAWHREKGKHLPPALRKVKLLPQAHETTTTLVYNAAGEPVAVTIIEDLPGDVSIITMRYHDYEKADAIMGDASRVLHYLDLSNYGPDTLMNMGAAVRGGDGLADAKAKLHPAKVLQLHTTQAAHKLTMDQWRACAPGNTPLPEPDTKPDIGSDTGSVIKSDIGSDTEPDTEPAAAPPPTPTAETGLAPVRWIVGDSTQVRTLAPGAYDLVFSCPPYADLEVYSDDPRDISNMPYATGFLPTYRAIIAEAVAMLRPNRFACFVVADIRDGDGLYRGFIGDTIAAFRDAGARLYNEAILINALGSLPIRVGIQFARMRKMGKTHQNVLVFVKGDPRLASEACGIVEVSLPEPEPDAEPVSLE